MENQDQPQEGRDYRVLEDGDMIFPMDQEKIWAEDGITETWKNVPEDQWHLEYDPTTMPTIRRFYLF